MRSRKLILILSVMVMILAIAAFVLAPSSAKAQGLVEYQLCLVFSQDIPPSAIVEQNDVAFVEEIFGITWEDDYGVIGYCTPMFTGKDKVLTGYRSTIIAYKDVNQDDGLSPGDTEVKRVRQTTHFPD